MMAAFIVAIRGTVPQAVLLGLSAAISHSLIIWVLAAGALQFGGKWDAERVEPFLQLGSAGSSSTPIDHNRLKRQRSSVKKAGIARSFADVRGRCRGIRPSNRQPRASQ